MAQLNEKKRLSSQWRTLLALSLVLTAALGGATWYLYSTIVNFKGNEAAAHQVDVVLKQTYLCGKSEESVHQEMVQSMDELVRKYNTWQLVSRNHNLYTFEKKVNDLAPECKNNAYFGINNNGELTLFDGIPQKGQTIQTFFHLDTKRLESSLPKEEIELLRRGIQIKDVAEYNSIISTYSEFSNEEEESAAL